MGWGRDELNNYYYWGGEIDLQQELQRQGFDVYTISVGPISSNWDRAIELYTQIKKMQTQNKHKWKTPVEKWEYAYNKVRKNNGQPS